MGSVFSSPPSRLNIDFRDAVDNNDLQTVKDTVRLGADPSFMPNRPDSPVYTALKHKNIEMLKFLLEHGSSPNRYGLPLEAPVYKAEEWCHEAYVLMLKHRAILNGDKYRF